MVEFAISVPFILLIMVSLLYFGKYYFLAQILLYTAQEGTKAASFTPNLSDPTVRDNFRGFTISGAPTNPNSIIYMAFSSAHLLSQGTTGNLPEGAKIEILPWDSDGTVNDIIPPGTIGLRVDYPMQLMGSPFNSNAQNQQIVGISMSNGAAPPVQFLNFIITQRAVAAQQLYQN